MYRCESCRAVVPPGTPAHRVVVETRAKEYPFRTKVNPPCTPDSRRKRLRKKRDKWHDDEGGDGREIVREQQVCSSCRGQRVVH